MGKTKNCQGKRNFFKAGGSEHVCADRPIRGGNLHFYAHTCYVTTIGMVQITTLLHTSQMHTYSHVYLYTLLEVFGSINRQTVWRFRFQQNLAKRFGASPDKVWWFKFKYGICAMVTTNACHKTRF